MTKILVIEDDDILRESVSDYLQDLSYFVYTAENGKTGLEILSDKEVEIIITDLRMPVMDGLEVLRNLSESIKGLPVIVVSGAGDISDAVEAMRLGAWDYILKPITEMEILSHSIDKVLEKARLLKENQEYQKNLEKLVEERTSSLEKSLKEKDVLLMELHHRVKNNLQFIVSLTSLQLSHSNCEEEMELESLYRRLKVFSDIHSSLYQYDKVAEIDFNIHLKNDFNSLVFQYTGNYRDNYTIDIKLSSPCIDLNNAVPCGLIINELMTSSIRKADHNGCNVLVEIVQDAGGAISSIIYKDQNLEFLPDETEFGTLLIDSMASQLGLTTEFHDDKNACIVFKKI